MVDGIKSEMNKTITELRLSHSFVDDDGKIRCRICKSLLQCSSIGTYHACENGCHNDTAIFIVNTLGSRYYKIVNRKLEKVTFFNDVLLTQEKGV